ncbi:hypothetical protein NMG60_11034329 [Bertholletia excelsa]
MGNYKFRLSDMMPNAWFYKLRDMSRTRTRAHNPAQSTRKKLSPPNATPRKPHQSQPRRSSYHVAEPPRPDRFYHSPTNHRALDTRFPEPPRRSSHTQRRSKRKTVYKPSPRLPAAADSVWANPISKIQDRGYLSSSSESSFEPEFRGSPLSEFEPNNVDASWSSSCSCRVTSSSTDIIIDVNDKSSCSRKVDGFDSIPEMDLPPILTKPAKLQNPYPESSKFEEIEALGSLSVKIVKEGSSKTRIEPKVPAPTRKSSAHSTGVKIRANSPRIAGNGKRIHGGRRIVSAGKGSKSQRRSFSAGSFAIVKSSFDPQRDFKDSMVEMIVENNIRASKDLEELLACYLSLNSDEYHSLIVKAFEQIWYDMAQLRL